MKTTAGVIAGLLVCSLNVYAQIDCEDFINKFCLFTINGKYGLYEEKKKKVALPAEYDSILADGIQSYYILAWKAGKPHPFNMKLESIKFASEYTSMRIVNTNDMQEAYLLVQDKRGEFIPVTENKAYSLGADLRVPGAIKVNDRLMISETEVTIKDWLIFMSHARHSMELPFSQTMPDTLKMHPRTRTILQLFLKHVDERDDIANQISLITKFNKISKEVNILYPQQLRDKSLAFYEALPVTGISYEQAQMYCRWLSELYDENTTFSERIKLNFRLPGKEEWESFVRAGLNEAMKHNNLFDSLSKDGCFLYNYKFASTCKGYEAVIKKYGSTGIMQVREFYPNTMGIYNLFGNVAEMVEERGIAKGGHYDLWARLCALDKDQIYSQPEPWLGFRWVAEVVLKEN
jgi:hypothetical protein